MVADWRRLERKWDFQVGRKTTETDGYGSMLREDMGAMSISHLLCDEGSAHERSNTTEMLPQRTRDPLGGEAGVGRRDEGPWSVPVVMPVKGLEMAEVGSATGMERCVWGRIGHPM
jgi:hypothetical protein